MSPVTPGQAGISPADSSIEFRFHACVVKSALFHCVFLRRLSRNKAYVLQVLTGQDHAGLLLADPLEAVPDVGHRHRIGKPEVQLIDGGHRISGGEKLVRQIGEHAEQQGTTPKRAVRH